MFYVSLQLGSDTRSDQFPIRASALPPAASIINGVAGECRRRETFIEVLRSEGNARVLNSILFIFKFSSRHVLQQVQQEYGKRSEGRPATTPRDTPTWLMYKDRLRKLKWPTLETRRLFLSLVECYKIVFGMKKT